MPEFVTLSCPSCSARLQVTNDLERFACGHCGNEHVVKRTGGVVSLAPVVDELKRVQSGVDRTASELAIRRLPAEIESLGQRYSDVWAQRASLNLLPFLRNEEKIDKLTRELDDIMSLAKKKKAELDRHRRLLDSPE